MNNSTLKIFVIGAVLLIFLFVGIYYLFFRSSPTSNSSYPKSVQKVINNPVTRNDGWGTLVNNDEYQISYSKTAGAESFFITINSQPVVAVAQKAEQELLQKLNINKDEACKLPLVINVTTSAAPNMSGFNFGLSFCPNVPHVEDIPPDPAPSGDLDPGV